MKCLGPWIHLENLNVPLLRSKAHPIRWLTIQWASSPPWSERSCTDTRLTPDVAQNSDTWGPCSLGHTVEKYFATSGWAEQVQMVPFWFSYVSCLLIKIQYQSLICHGVLTGQSERDCERDILSYLLNRVSSPPGFKDNILPACLIRFLPVSMFQRSGEISFVLLVNLATTHLFTKTDNRK